MPRSGGGRKTIRANVRERTQWPAQWGDAIVTQPQSGDPPMKIAAYNVENFFDRAKAFDADQDTASAILSAESRFNQLISKLVYADEDKAEMAEHLKTLRLWKTDEGPYAYLRRLRGRFINRPRDKKKPITIVAKGRQSWVGWAELKTAPVNETAILNTGRVIRDVDADILAVVEAENRIVLRQFSDTLLRKVLGRPYDQIMLIDGNDERGIDVGLMSKLGYDIGLMRSHVHDLNEFGGTIFARDCPEYAVTTPHGETIWVLPNHLNSKFGGDTPAKRARREGQARQVAAIYERLRSEGHDKVVVLGDFNDTPDSPPLQPLLADTDLRDISEHPSFDTGKFKGKGTFGPGTDRNKIDYLLLSPALFKRVTKGGLFRMGAWPGKRPKWTVYPELDRRDQGRERPPRDLGGDCRSLTPHPGGVEGVGEVAGPGKGGEEDHIEAQRALGEPRVAGDVVFGGAHEALLVDREQGVRLGAATGAALHLDEDGGAEALGDEVDLAHRRFHAPGTDAVELQTQIPGRDVLAAAAEEFGREPLRTFRP
jgi:endonuclease/exonuclease/phosphatase family metal-dependent hydrolase